MDRAHMIYTQVFIFVHFQLGFDRFFAKFKDVLKQYVTCEEGNQYGNIGLQFLGLFLSSCNAEDDNSQLFKETITYLLNVSFFPSVYPMGFIVFLFRFARE